MSGHHHSYGYGSSSHDGQQQQHPGATTGGVGVSGVGRMSGPGPGGFGGGTYQTRAGMSIDVVGNFGRDGRPMSEQEFLEDKLKQGRCPTCNQKLFLGRLLKMPLNVPNKVKNGICLICHPPTPKKGGSGGGTGPSGGGVGNTPTTNRKINPNFSSPQPQPPPPPPSPLSSSPYHRVHQTPITSPSYPHNQYPNNPNRYPQPKQPPSGSGHAAVAARYQQPPPPPPPAAPATTITTAASYDNSDVRDPDYDDDTICFEPSVVEAIPMPQSLPQTSSSSSSGPASSRSPHPYYDRYYVPPSPLHSRSMPLNTTTSSTSASAASSTTSRTTQQQQQQQQQKHVSPPSPIDELNQIMEEFDSISTCISSSSDNDDDNVMSSIWEDTIANVIHVMQTFHQDDLVQIRGLRVWGYIITQCRQYYDLQNDQEEHKTDTTTNGRNNHLLFVSPPAHYLDYLFKLTSHPTNPDVVMNAFMILWTLSECNMFLVTTNNDDAIRLLQQSMECIQMALHSRPLRNHFDTMQYVLLFLYSLLLKCCKKDNGYGEDDNNKDITTATTSNSCLDLFIRSFFDDNDDGRLMTMNDLLDVSEHCVSDIKVSEVVCRLMLTISGLEMFQKRILFLRRNNEEGIFLKISKALYQIMDHHMSDCLIQTLICQTFTNLLQIANNAEQEDSDDGSQQKQQHQLLIIKSFGGMDRIERLIQTICSALKHQQQHNDQSHGQDEPSSSLVRLKEVSLTLFTMICHIVSLPVLRRTVDTVIATAYLWNNSIQQQDGEGASSSLSQTAATSATPTTEHTNNDNLSDFLFFFFGRAAHVAIQKYSQRMNTVKSNKMNNNNFTARQLSELRQDLMDALSILNAISMNVDISPLLNEPFILGMIKALQMFTTNVEYCRLTFAVLASVVIVPYQDNETLCHPSVVKDVHGAMSVIVQCIITHGIDCIDISQRGEELLNQFLWLHPDSLGVGGVITSIELTSLLKIWQKHRSDAPLQGGALILLRNLFSSARSSSSSSSTRSDDNSNKKNGNSSPSTLTTMDDPKLFANIVQYIVDVMDEHSQSVAVQEEALMAFWSLLSVMSSPSSSAGTAGGAGGSFIAVAALPNPTVKRIISTILNVMDQHGYCLGVQDAALACLSILATSIPSCAMDIIEKGGAQRAINGCRIHDSTTTTSSNSGNNNATAVGSNSMVTSTTALTTSTIEGVHEKSLVLLCTLAKSTSNSDASITKHILSMGAVPLAVLCLQLFPTSVKLCKASIQLLAILSQEPSAVVAVVASPDAIAAGMAVPSSSSFSSSDEQEQKQLCLFAKEGVHEALVTLMSAPDLDPMVIEMATKLFLLIVSSRSPHLEKIDVIQIVISAMNNHPQSIEVQERGITALSELSVKDPEAKDTIALLGGVQCIVKAMKDHLSSMLCCEKGCIALWSLGMKETVRDTIVECHGITAIVHAMLAHMAHEPVVQSVCGALITLTSQSSQCRNAFRAADGTSTLVAAMKVYYNNAPILEQCCNVLSNLAVQHEDDTMIDQVTLDQLQTIARCMKYHSKERTLQKSALRTLWNLSLIPTNITIMQSSTTNELLQDVLFAASTNFPNECGERVQRLFNLIF